MALLLLLLLRCGADVMASRTSTPQQAVPPADAAELDHSFPAVRAGWAVWKKRWLRRRVTVPLLLGFAAVRARRAASLRGVGGKKAISCCATVNPGHITSPVSFPRHTQEVFIGRRREPRRQTFLQPRTRAGTSYLPTMQERHPPSREHWLSEYPQSFLRLMDWIPVTDTPYNTTHEV